MRRAERRVPEESRRLRREEIWLAERRQLALERLPARPDAQVDVLPVVEAGAFHLALVEREAERLDEMQRGAGGEAGAAGVAGFQWISGWTSTTCMDTGAMRVLALEKRGRNRLVGAFVVPHYADDPPPGFIVENWMLRCHEVDGLRNPDAFRRCSTLA